MINKIRRKFVLISITSVFSLLLLVLLVINITNFTMVANDADRTTQQLASEQGEFKEFVPQGGDKQFEPGDIQMGPDAPENRASMRYFTVALDKKGNAEIVAFNLTEESMTEDEAIELAKSLAKQQTGWVKTVYRYRVYKANGKTYVSVVDQTRELTPSYNVLKISAISLVLGIVVLGLILIKVSKYVVKPVVDSDNKQKRFIKDATYALKAPATIIEQNNQLLREELNKEYNDVIDNQIEKINELINNMNTLSIIDNPKKIEHISFMAKEEIEPIVDSYVNWFKEKNIDFVVNYEADSEIVFDKQLFRRIVKEIIDNGLKYSETKFVFEMKNIDSRLTIITKNDILQIKDGDQAKVFERFYRLDNDKTKENPGNGLGLAVLYEVVKKFNGRASAKVKDSEFILKVEI